MKGFYIKQSKRVHESGYKCFNIYDENKKFIRNFHCDVIDIEFENIKKGCIMFEIVGNMIHIWTHDDFEISDLFTSTFYTNYKEKSQN